MDYSVIKDKLYKDIDENEVVQAARAVMKDSEANVTPEICTECLALIDLTSLNITDSPAGIRHLAEKISKFRRTFPKLPQVASICVAPVFVETVGLALGESEMSITSVGGGFPSSQTFLEVKMLECSMAEENGADEVDIVMNIGQFEDGNYDLVANEIEMIRNELDESTILKVIIESGILGSLSDVRMASILAMAAGADFIKTSTGKNGAGATPEAVVVMCRAIKDFFEYSGEKVGIKVSGGIKTAADAALYYTIVKNILGTEWLTPELMRIGSSSLANNLLTVITGKRTDYY